MPKPTRGGKPHRAYSVFISHSSRDNWVAGVMADNPWLTSEVGAAFSLRKRITPVVIGKPSVAPAIRQFDPISYSELPRYISELQERTKGEPSAKTGFTSLTKGTKHVRSATRR